MPTNRSLPKTTIMAPTGWLFGSQQGPDDNVGASHNNAGNTPSKDTQFRQPTNQIHPPPGYSDLPSQLPFPGAPQFYHHAPFNLKPSSEPSTGATKGYRSYASSWRSIWFPPRRVWWTSNVPPLSNSQDMGPHVQVYLKCLEHRLETIQSFSKHLLPLLQQDNIPVHLGDPTLVSQQNDYSRLQNHGGQMWQVFPICLYYQRSPMTNTTKIMRPTIHRIWAGPKVKPQSIRSKWNSP